LGVDLEWPGNLSQPDLVAESFSELEQATLQTLPPPEQQHAVLALWCAKEAAAKCVGTGLDGHIKDFTVGMDLPLRQTLSVFFEDIEIPVSFAEHHGAIIAFTSIPLLESN
jgi:phosphopantetheinyl transferase